MPKSAPQASRIHDDGQEENWQCGFIRQFAYYASFQRTRELAKVHVLVNEKRPSAINDTGAIKKLMAVDFMFALSLQSNLKASRAFFKMANGAHSRPTGYFKDVELQLGLMKHTSDFYVLPDVGYKMIIELPILKNQLRSIWVLT